MTLEKLKNVYDIQFDGKIANKEKPTCVQEKFYPVMMRHVYPGDVFYRIVDGQLIVPYNNVIYVKSMNDILLDLVSQGNKELKARQKNDLE